MTLWFTSDLHFGHKNIVEKGWRPFDSVDEMNKSIINNINSVVRDFDTLIIVGDACMGKKDDSIPLLGSLNGAKVLVPGNHDPMHPIYEKRDWKRLEWRRRYYEEADVVCSGPESHTYIGSERIKVCHFPYSGDHTGEERFTNERPVDDGSWLIHGHTHGMWKVNGRQIDVGMDAWDFMPVHIDTIKEIIDGG